MQHYRVPTRLLDWTESALIALYFALFSRKSGQLSPAAVWVLDPFALNNITLRSDEILVPTDARFEAHLPKHGSTVQCPLPVAVHPEYSDRRMHAQHSKFTLHGSVAVPLDEMTELRGLRENGRLVRVLIGGQDDDAIDSFKDSLSLLGVRSSTVFPDLEGLAMDICRDYTPTQESSKTQAACESSPPIIRGLPPFDLMWPVDRVIAADVDGDGRDGVVFYRPGYGAAALIKWRVDGDFEIVFDHTKANNRGIGPFDLMKSADRIIAADVDGDGRDELLLYRPGSGAASLIRVAGGKFDVIFDHSGASTRNTGIGSFDLKRSVDRVIAGDVDGDGKDELLLYRPGYGTAHLLRWVADDKFDIVFAHGEGPGHNDGIGPFDLMNPADRIIAADVDGDGHDELLLYRPGSGAAFLIRVAGHNFPIIFDHPDAPGRNIGVGPFDFLRSVDRVIASDVDGDGKDELLFYRPGYGAASLLKWKAGDSFTTVFHHPEIGKNTGIGCFDLADQSDRGLSIKTDGRASKQLFYRPGHGAAVLMVWKSADTFQILLNHSRAT